jgi:hypothetical protein
VSQKELRIRGRRCQRHGFFQRLDGLSEILAAKLGFAQIDPGIGEPRIQTDGGFEPGATIPRGAEWDEQRSPEE